MSEFWLNKWMDEAGIRKQKDLEKALKPGSSGRVLLYEIASEVRPEGLVPMDHGESILAGRGIDLSGALDCCNVVCQTKQVDELFSKALHYFDEIIVSGPSAVDLVEGMDAGEPGAVDRVEQHALALLYIRKIGADNFLTFVQKPPPCSVHYRDHAREAGLDNIVEESDRWVGRLASGGHVSGLRQCGNHWHFQFSHPDLEHSAWATAASGPGGSEPSMDQMAEAVCARYVSHLVSDVMAAQALNVPLGASVRLHEDMLAHGLKTAPAPGDVAFEMKLPVVREMSIADVIKFRLDEYEHFQAFKSALVAAIDERMSSDLTSEEIGREL